ncbi:hypothetical protein [Aurantiacibacter sediminis]|uniref:Uncharacterized protein n=1 Tax=Aurantiacibacter sediminis TaxID=2793064 RepID=A0ABS0N3N3_9SPHN|nr:hypothetical protein [Aurantiacibacter sediminis]MBH5322579.1 hypothetical protein [Aurantiacibacter sediminis]
MLAGLLLGCGNAPSEDQRAAEDAAIADRVREANETGPPIEEVVPETISYPDMETNDLLGQGCAYAPGTSMGVRVIARETDAYLKIDGEMVRFAADPGSRELPSNTRSLYNGRTHSLRLAVGEVAQEGEIEDTTFEGTMWLYDRWDRVVYTGTGTANCGV